MGNKKNELENFNLPPVSEKTICYIGAKGNETSESEALAKKVTCNYNYSDISVQYFVRVGRGELIDPYQIDYGITKNKLSSMYKYKKVSEKAYNTYVKYLTNKNRIHFTTARRLIME
jgi:hypothetical protein